MLVMLATGEQRLVMFDIPNEDCTVHDLLEQLRISFCSDTTVSLVSDPALGVNYIVQTGIAAVGSSYDITDHSDSNSAREIMSSSTEKNVDDQHAREYLQNDNEKASINILNNYCLWHIFEFLPILDRIRLERVCRRWRAMSLESGYMVRVLDFCSSEWKSINRRSMCDSVFHKLLLKCGRFLTQLRLSNIYISLPDDALNTVGQLCPNLTNVNFNEIDFTASDIDALAKNCKNITRLVIGKSSHDLDNELSNLFTHNKLEYLEINGNKLLSKCLTSLPAESLRTLILYRCDYICEDYFCGALERLGGLEKLVISVCGDEYNSPLNQRILENINQHCINLKVLDLKSSVNNDPYLRPLNFTNLVKLEKIAIAYEHHNLHSDITNMVLNCRELIDVDVTDCGVTDDMLACIATLPKLEGLNISCVSLITDKGLRHLHNLKVLKCRGLSMSTICKGLSMVLRSSPELKLLDISYTSGLHKQIVEVAKEVCNRRDSNVILKIIVIGTFPPSDFVTTTNDNCTSVIEVSPFLVVKVDYSRDESYRGIFSRYTSDEIDF